MSRKGKSGSFESILQRAKAKGGYESYTWIPLETLEKMGVYIGKSKTYVNLAEFLREAIRYRLVALDAQKMTEIDLSLKESR